MMNQNNEELEKTQQIKEIKLKSEMYNHNSEHIERREENNDAVMWGFVIGFALFFVLLILIIVFIN